MRFRRRVSSQIQSGGFTNLLCKSVKCLERIKSALQRKRSGILLSPATNLLSVRFHIVDKYLHSLIIETSFQISRGFLLPDRNVEWFAALFETFPRTCDVRYFLHFFINSARFRKNGVFFFFVIRFRLVILFILIFFGLLVRFFPRNQIFQRKRPYSSYRAPRVIWSFLVVRTRNTFALLQTS